MKLAAGQVAVVTGAAGGIGRALAGAFAPRGLAVVLSDEEEPALDAAVRELADAGHTVRAVPADVSRPDQVETLAQRAEAEAGPVQLLCNNAGVFAGGLSWEARVEDYAWVWGVNVWGVVHGLRSFVPRLRAHGREAHVVNTASMAALTGGPLAGPYMASKHAVLSLTETLFHELRGQAPHVGVSVLCPEAVDTGIAESERNRPRDGSPEEAAPATSDVATRALRTALRGSLPPAAIAERVCAAIEARRFWILPEGHPGWRRAMELRCEDVLRGRDPTFFVAESAWQPDEDPEPLR